jgi:hypothetical protein
MIETINLGMKSPDEVLADQKSKAKLLFMKIEKFMNIKIPNLEGTKEERLIDRDAYGYDQQKKEIEAHL